MKSFFMFLLCVTFLGNAALYPNDIALSQWVFQVRDPKTDAKAFRQSLEKIGEYLSLQVLNDLPKQQVSIQTLTETIATHDLVLEAPVLVTILRAGIPLCTGVQRVFPESEVGFIGMSRNEETLEAKTDYVALPSLKNKAVLIVDTMLATGGSLLEAIKIVEKKGPSKILVLCAIAAQPGIKRIQEYAPQIKIYSAAIDPALNDKGYIIPGLGDAGDRSYGKKE